MKGSHGSGLTQLSFNLHVIFAFVSRLTLTPLELSLNTRRSTMAPQHIYEPLDPSKSEFRLIEQVTHGRNNTITYNLMTVSMHDKSNFAALSYVWGDPTVTEDINVNGHAVP